MMNEYYNKYLDKIINALPKTKKQKKVQNIFDIIICILFLLSFFLIAFFLKANKTFLVFILGIILYGLLVVVVFIRKRYYKNYFYKVKDAEKNIELITITDNKIVDMLYKESAITFISDPTTKMLNFIYNWLNNLDLLKEERINIYVLSGKDLKNKFGYKNLPNITNLLSIPLNSLDINDSNMEDFSKGRFAVGARYLDDLINISKK